MTSFPGARVARVVALFGACLTLAACGNGSIGGTSALPVGESRAEGSAASRTRAPESEAVALAELLELDLRLQGVGAAHARAIAQGALDGSLVTLDSMGLIDLKSFLPGFLKGALGVAKTLFAGTPVGVAGTIVEAIVRGVSKQGAAPKDVLHSLPAVALETLKPKGGGLQDMLAALLAAGRGVTAGATPDDSRSMMEALVTALARQSGMGPDALALLLPALQDNLQSRIVAMPPSRGTDTRAGFPRGSDGMPSVGGSTGNPLGASSGMGGASPLASLLAAISEGQFNALVGLGGPHSARQGDLLSLLFRRGAESLMGRAGVRDEGLRLELLQALAAGASRPLGSLDAASKETKHDLLQALASTLTRSVLGHSGGAGPLKQRALEAALLGLSRGMISKGAASAAELSDVFARVSQALGRGVVSQPGTDDDVRQMLLSTLGQAQVRAVDTTSGATEDTKKSLLDSALRGLASGVSKSAPQGELLEVLLAVLNDRASRPTPPPMPTTEEDLLRILQVAHVGL